ncbi:small ribosomal subunit protein mS23 [Nelusetta ayraudi]|uniref:small ribosomal subunit protein mS23 n=1 Tax=Nelusetta ayraudi TaxID=303726 RepID=UPI003F71DB87
MAGSRLTKFGTVFTRVRDLVHSGVITRSEKPIWYDVYAAFPPKREPLHMKPCAAPFAQKVQPVAEIFYPEDEVKARFYEQYGMGPRPLDLSKSNFVSTCQKFVDKYSDLEGSEEQPDATLFEASARALLAEGILLKTRAAPPVSAGSRDLVLELKLSDMMAEHQLPSTGSEETSK